MAKGKNRVGMKVSGNPDVFEEAEKKDGGRVKRKKGGRIKLGFMTGGGVKARLDRPGRKTGGGVGANFKPLSSAHEGVTAGGETPNPRDTYGGTKSD